MRRPFCRARLWGPGGRPVQCGIGAGAIFFGVVSRPDPARPGRTRRARLRTEGLIAGRRDGKSVHYRLSSEAARRTMLLLYEPFCEPARPRRGKAARPIEVAAE